MLKALVSLIRKFLMKPFRLICPALGLMLALAGCGDSPTSTPAPIAAPTAAASAVLAPTRRPTVSGPSQQPTDPPGQLTTRATPADVAEVSPLLAQHLVRVQTALQATPPVLLLEANMSAEQIQAQRLAIADSRFQENLFDPTTHAPLRNEIFGVYPVNPGDIISTTEACRTVQCWRVEMYNYAFNIGIVGVVDMPAKQVLAVSRLVGMQPDIPPELTQIAREIAANSPEVIEVYGKKPDLSAAVMASTKSTLGQSRCERSGHLCVAPTFVEGSYALWVIVDLTEGSIVGLRWTNVGKVPTTLLTEKSLQDEVVTAQYCEKVNTVDRQGWQFDYVLTSSDGLRVANVRYNGQPVLTSAKVVDWHVSYSTRDGFGYADGTGCPVFSSSAVVAFNGPSVKDLPSGADTNGPGFAIEQNFQSEVWPQPCNYRYSQRYEFYTDGRFRVVVANHGRGCGNDGTYRPVVRMAFPNPDTFAMWNGQTWADWTTEQWQGPTDTVTSEGYQFKLANAQGQGFYVAPSRGQFHDNGRGDNPFVYITKQHAEAGQDEGEADLITIGPCCNNDYRQGPEKFIEPQPESLANSSLVMWYVPQIKNDDTPGKQYCWADAVLKEGVYVPVDYPCYAGPMFVPIR